MRLAPISLLSFALAVLVAPSCVSPRTSGTDHAAPVAAQTAPEPAEKAEFAGVVTSKPAAASVPSAHDADAVKTVVPPADATHKNRDKHGEPDVAKYIDVLQRKERVADLQIDVVLEKLELPVDADIGDLGCGPGLFSVAFAKQCPEGVVYASDIEPAQLDAVRARIHAEKLANIVPVLASEDDPHFPPARLDVIFIGDTYHHLDDRIAYTKKLATMLKPDGRLVILDYKPGELPVGPPPAHKLAAHVMENELAAAGWTRIATFDTHPYHDFEIWRVVHPWEKK
jgi:SAM-dependent methyltransferase